MSKIMFAILLLLIGAPLFGQAPISVFGDLNVTSRLNPGVGIIVPMNTSTGLVGKVSKNEGSVKLTGGISHAFVHIQNDTVNLGVSVGSALTTTQAYFVHEYSVSYGRWINQKWTVSPYLKYGFVGGIGGWSAGAVVAYRLYR